MSYPFNAFLILKWQFQPLSTLLGFLLKITVFYFSPWQSVPLGTIVCFSAVFFLLPGVVPAVYNKKAEIKPCILKWSKQRAAPLLGHMGH